MELLKLESFQTLIVAPTFTLKRAFLGALRERVGEDCKLEQIGLIADCLPCFSLNDIALISPCLGAPAAGLLARHCFQANSISRCLLLSAVGSLGQLQVGDLFLADSLLGEDGVSRSLGLADPQPFKRSSKSGDLLENSLSRAGEPLTRGLLCTLDFPLEAKDTMMLDKLAANGVSAVDMECSPLSALAEMHQVDFAAVFVVSDVVTKGERGFSSAAFRSSLRCASSALAELALTPV